MVNNEIKLPDRPVSNRVVIEGVTPQIDYGRFPAKRCLGDRVIVEADIFTDGHQSLGGRLLFRHESEADWRNVPLEPLVNDRWSAAFQVTKLGTYQFTLEAWLDPFQYWRRSLQKKFEAGQDVSLELLEGSEWIEQAAQRAAGRDRTQLQEFAGFLRVMSDTEQKVSLGLDQDLADLMSRCPDRSRACRFERELSIKVEREKARFSAWYELFPRSCGEGKRHGTFQDCIRRLPYIAEMGFDVLYLPPIHPIGEINRKGRNNSRSAEPTDCGSPWAIGSPEGGHKAIHPELGTLQDFHQLVREAGELGIEVALDIAFQCSPDHPWVKQHPEWFKRRPDGSIQHAENPPKKYEDIFPLEFGTSEWKSMWVELKSVFEYWVEQGVQIFRVDNPHTKSFPFWEWVIAEIQRSHPEVIFLSEAFTRPKLMYRLAKVGFTQSYTYFAWRTTKWELTEYFTELTQTEVAEYFRPNAWPNTPDILTEQLQLGERSVFMQRLVLAATLCANYGIYGPPFELCESRPRERHSEEYLDSEKYEIRDWDTDRADSLKEFLARVNRIRKENPALHDNGTLQFHPVDNEQLICYSKRSEQNSNLIIVVVNLDPYHTHSGWIELPLDHLGVPLTRSYQVHDLLSESRFFWHGSRNYVEINPQVVPAHVLRLRRYVRSERDFDYFL